MKIGFVLAKKGGIGRWGGGGGGGGGGGFQYGVPCTWQLPWLAVEKPWYVLAGPFLTFLAQTGSQEPLPSPCRGTISGLVGSIQSGGVLTHSKEPTVVKELT